MPGIRPSFNYNQEEPMNTEHDDSLGVIIPIEEATKLAKTYGYDQVVIYARLVGEGGIEAVTTYGVDAIHKAAAARIGEALRLQVVPVVEQRNALLEDVRQLRNTVSDYGFQLQWYGNIQEVYYETMQNAFKEGFERGSGLSLTEEETIALFNKSKAKEEMERMKEWESD